MHSNSNRANFTHFAKRISYTTTDVWLWEHTEQILHALENLFRWLQRWFWRRQQQCADQDRLTPSSSFPLLSVTIPRPSLGSKELCVCMCVCLLGRSPANWSVTNLTAALGEGEGGGKGASIISNLNKTNWCLCFCHLLEGWVDQAYKTYTHRDTQVHTRTHTHKHTLVALFVVQC